MQDIHHLPQQGFRHMVHNAVFDVPQRLRRIRRLDLWLVPVVLAAFLGLWEVVIWAGDYPKFILPSVADVASSFSRTVQDGTLWRHTAATLVEVFGGLALGLTVALVLGYTLAKNEVIERLVSPYLVASQSIPTVAIAPLLIIWFGAGQLSKILIAALIVFFPALVNTIVGIRAVDHDLRDLMRALKADRWQTFWLLEVPAAMPVLLAGLKVSVTLSVIGAVIGEFMGADKGLGFLINQARGLFNTPLVFVAIISLVMITVSLYGGVTLLERWLLRWQRDGRG